MILDASPSLAAFKRAAPFEFVVVVVVAVDDDVDGEDEKRDILLELHRLKGDKRTELRDELEIRLNQASNCVFDFA